MISKIINNKEFLWTIIAQASSMIGNIVLLKLLAIHLRIGEFGYYALINSILAIIMILPFGVILQGISRYVSVYEQKKRFRDFLSRTLFIYLLLFAAVLICLSLLRIIEVYNIIFVDFFINIVVLTFASSIKTFFTSINNSLRYRQNIAFAVLLEFSLKIILIILLHRFYNLSIISILWIFTVAELISALMLIYKVKNQINLGVFIDKKTYIMSRRIFVYSAPLMIWAIFSWLRDMSNRWCINFFLDKETVGLFSMVTTISIIFPMAIQSIIGAYLIPILYHKENTQKGISGKIVAKIIPFLFLALLIIGFFVFLFDKKIVLLLASQQYVVFAWMLPWFFISYSLFSLSVISTYQMFAENKTQSLIPAYVLSGIFAIISNYFLIKYFRIDGAVYSFISTYLLCAILTFNVTYNYWRKNAYH